VEKGISLILVFPKMISTPGFKSLIDSEVPAWLGLKARALAWLWLRPRLRAIYIKNNYIYIIYHNLRVIVFERVRESGGG